MSEELGVVLTGADFKKITEAAGGINNFLQALAVFNDKFFTEVEKLDRARQEMERVFRDLGLAVPATREAFRALVESLDLTTEAGQRLYGQLISMAPAMDQFYTALESTGEVIEDTARNAEQLADLMRGVDDQLAALTLSPFQLEIRDINRWLEETTATAREYGASLEDLARIQQVAALRTQQALDQIRSEIDALVGQLYGVSGGDTQQQLQDRYNAERERLRELQRQADELYRTELRRYEASQAAAERINQFLAGLLQGNLSPLTPLQKLDASRSQFQSTLAAAAGGDTDALGRVTGDAQAFLTASRAYFASSAPYGADFDMVVSNLQDLAQQLGLVTEPSAPGDVDTSALLQQIEDELRRLREEEEAEKRRLLARELAEKVGDLGLALDRSVFELMEELGIDIRQLATDFGLDLGTMDASLVKGLDELADLLHTDLAALAGALDLNFGDLGSIIADEFEAAFTDTIGPSLEMNTLELVGPMEDLVRLANGELIALEELFAQAETDNGVLLQIAGISSTQTVQLTSGFSDVRAALNQLRQVQTEQDLRDAMENLKQSVEALPPEYQALISPELMNIVNSNLDAGQLVGDSVDDLTTTLMATTADYQQRTAENTWAILGQSQAQTDYLFWIEKWTKETRDPQYDILWELQQLKTEVAAIVDQAILLELQSINSSLGGGGGSSHDLRPYLNTIANNVRAVETAVIAIQDQAIRLNLREQNVHLGIPSYQQGTNFVPRDMLARLHQGEMVINAQTAEILRRADLNLAAASNDRDYRSRPMRGFEPREDQVAEEISLLRQEVAELKAQLADQHNKSVRQKEALADRAEETARELAEDTPERAQPKKVA